MVLTTFFNVSFRPLFFAIALLLVKATPLFAQTCNLIDENFETQTNLNPLPLGWTYGGLLYSVNSASTAHSGLRYVGMRALNDSLVIKPLDCPGALSFWWRASGASSDYDVKTYYSQNAGATWTQVDAILLTGSGSPTAYQQRTIDLPEGTFTTGSQILLKMKMTRRPTTTSGSIYIDDMCVSRGVCAMNLSFSSYAFSCVEVAQPVSFTVCKQDVAGTIDNTFTGSIAISKASGSGSVGGTLSRNATAGCATFNDITFSATGNYVLTAANGALSQNSKTIPVSGSCAFNSIRIMSYNLLNFPNGRNDCGAGNLVIPNRQDTLKIITNYIQPDVLMVCELQTQAGADAILNQTLNTGGTTYWRAANFVLNTSPGGTVLNNMFYYNSNKMTLYSQRVIPTDVRDISLYTVFLNDPNLASHHDTIFADFYVTHLKAGTASTDTLSRNYECLQLQNFVASRPNRNAFFGGDLNFYKSSTIAYQYITTGANPFVDPINTPGDWDSNPAFARVHTQSTRIAGIDMDCGATGGIDSRLDFVFASTAAMAGSQHITVQPTSYQPLGNNGSTYNKNIHDAANTSGVPRAVLFALFYMSDHLPVLVDAGVSFPAALPLPVTLLSFEAKEQDNSALLTWNVASETNFDKYIVERSTDGVNFQPIAEIKSRKIANTTYLYTDNQVRHINYYRLKLLDLDGKTAYSEVRVVRLNKQPLFVYPNPVAETLYFLADVPQETAATVAVYDLFGKIILKQSLSLNNGTNTLEIPVYLPSGNYVLQVQSSSFARQTVFTKY